MNLFPRTADEIRARLAELDEQIAAQDDFTDRHPYPSGLNKSRGLRWDRDFYRKRLAELERQAK